jgi:V/A-type H+-transporting ATPase subunit I
MIAPMDALLVVGRRRIAHELLSSLQSLGVVQVEPVDAAEGMPLLRLKLQQTDKRAKEGWDALVAKSEALIDAISAQGMTPGTRDELPTDLEGLESYLGDINVQVEQLIAERAEIRDELDIVGSYLPFFRELAPSLAQFERSRYLHGSAFALAPEALERTRAALEEALDGRIVLSARALGPQLVVIAAILKSDRQAFQATLGRLGIGELQLPPRYANLGFAKAVHVMEERSQTLPKRQRVIEDELTKLRAQYGAKLHTLRQIALNHQARYAALEAMAEGRYSFVLRGWVPSADRAKVVDGLKRQFGDDIVVEARHADGHHDHGVPVKLENPGWVTPFERLLSLFAPPAYGSFDPSWTLAVFFPLFFGIVVGDIGFGLLFLALGLWLRARGNRGRDLDLGPLGIVLPAAILPSIGSIVNWCAGWSILFGFLYGEFFGNLLEYLPAGRPIFYTPLHHEAGYGLIPIVLFRVEQFYPLLFLSLGFGVLQVLGGWVIRAYYGYLHHDRKHLWEGIGMFAGLLAIVVFSYGFLTEALTPVIWAVVGVGFAVFLLGVILSGVVLMIVELISNSGHILSYLRLFAVGLSAALVANLATGLGLALAGVAPVIGPILGILVGLTVHLVAIALTIIGHTLQPLRLQYVEFFTKFGFYEESGRPYNPLRLTGGKA